jgi:protein-disulfide isomerase
MTRRMKASLAAIFIAMSLSGTAGAEDLTPDQKNAIIATVRDAMAHDPSILRGAIAAMQAADAEQQKVSARDGIQRSRDALYNQSADPFKGNPDGKVVIVEFFDPRCSYCKALQPRLTEALKANPDVKLVLKDFPILGPNSVLASRALLASQKQGKYAAFQQALMELKEDPNEQVLQQVASSVGVDWSRLRADMDDPEVQQRLRANIALGRELQVQGTPALVISDQLVPGAIDAATLDTLLSRAREQLQKSGHS